MGTADTENVWYISLYCPGRLERAGECLFPTPAWLQIAALPLSAASGPDHALLQATSSAALGLWILFMQTRLWPFCCPLLFPHRTYLCLPNQLSHRNLLVCWFHFLKYSHEVAVSLLHPVSPWPGHMGWQKDSGGRRSSLSCAFDFCHLDHSLQYSCWDCATMTSWQLWLTWGNCNLRSYIPCLQSLEVVLAMFTLDPMIAFFSEMKVWAWYPICLVLLLLLVHGDDGGGWGLI